MALNLSGLSKKQMDELHELLQKKLNDVEVEIKDFEYELKEDGSSDEQGAADEIDRSSYEEAMQRSQLVLAGKHKLREEIKYALEKFDEGTYGICEESEEAIGYNRLKAQPWTRYSLEAQKEMETNNKIHQGMRNSSGSYPSGAAEE